MKEMERSVRSIKADGLVWGACKLYYIYCIIFIVPLAKLVPLAYGIHKLQISCVVEDEKV